MNFHDIKNVHFVGIGGIGMSGIAEILAQAGVSVSGCDLKRSSVTDSLARKGIRVSIGHDPAHLGGVDLVVVTAAVRGRNGEIDTAHERGIEVVRRSEILGEIVNRKRAVGVSGTHGKTTTSSMISVVLEEAGLDPTVLVGGVVRNLSTNAKSGKGDFLVVEADEYDRTFHQLHPEIAVITNIEADHLEYYGSFEAILEAFRIFIEGVKPGGSVIACIDDPAVAQLIGAPGSSRRVITYGLSEGAQLRAINLRFTEGGARFEVPGTGAFQLLVPGEHNVRNALAAIAVARELGVESGVIARGLSRFLGVERRFQILGEFAGAIVVDDYAHHPTEIRATLEAARRGYPERRIVALFQPHLYSRTRDFAGDFAAALGAADVAIVSPIYAAREEPLSGISARLITDAGENIEYLDYSNEEIVEELRGRLGAKDLFITMGAGDVHQIGEALVAGGGA
ncbi:MAG TPA: UDP-N-acetylmuramate--L-alanine ligase [Thermoanaerobaculia bacterium]|nr:UDP-N-acetylmuramate--L-alanine ligase [Thermoanaerobaculia bacterium]